jgi:ribosomal protein L24
MKRFKDWLYAENAKRLGEGQAIIESFYPYDFLKGGRPLATPSKTQGKGVSTATPSDFESFVFLKTTESDIYNIVHDRWNLDFRIRLMHYLDPAGKHAVVPDKMMDDFFEACLKYRGCFEVAPSIKGIETMDKVEILKGPFAGQEASVVKVHHQKGEVHLDLSIPMVSGVMSIRMPHVDKRQVAILDRNAVDAIRKDFIEYTQNHLLTILEHRIKRVEDEAVNQRDASMLNRLFRYRNHQVENESARHHFLALMLICAHLCRSASEEQLKQEALAALSEINKKSESKAATDTRTYLWIALYISTHSPSYRDAAKEYVRVHQPKSSKLRRFVTLIRTGKKV